MKHSTLKGSVGKSASRSSGGHASHSQGSGSKSGAHTTKKTSDDVIREATDWTIRTYRPALEKLRDE